MKFIEEMSKFLPLVHEYPHWVQLVFLTALAFVLATVFLGIVYHPSIHDSPPSSRSNKTSDTIIRSGQKVSADLAKRVILRGEWEEQNILVQRYQRSSSGEDRLIAETIAEMIESGNDRQLEMALAFLQGHLWFDELRKQDALSLASCLAAISDSANARIRQAIASIFHSQVDELVIPTVFGFMRRLVKDKDVDVREAALRNIGNLAYKAPAYVENEIWDILCEAWRSETTPKTRAAALTSIKHFSDSEESDSRKKKVSQIVAEALLSQSNNIIHSALWVLGGLGSSFEPTDDFNDAIFERLLVVYRSNRQIPRSWFLSAFTNVKGELPSWAEEKLAKDQQQEKEERQERMELEQILLKKAS